MITPDLQKQYNEAELVLVPKGENRAAVKDLLKQFRDELPEPPGRCLHRFKR